MVSSGIGKTHCAAYGPRQAQSLSTSETTRSTIDDQLQVGWTVREADSPKEEMS